jgi:hypothetical protein
MPAPRSAGRACSANALLYISRPSTTESRLGTTVTAAAVIMLWLELQSEACQLRMGGIYGRLAG